MKAFLKPRLNRWLLQRLNFGLAVLFTVIAESGCRVQAGNPQSGTSSKPGTVTVAIADAPVDDLSQLFFKVNAVAFAPEGKGRCLKEPSRRCADSAVYYYDLNHELEIDILSLSGGRTQVLPFSQELPAGTYEGIRLFLSENSSIEGVLKTDGTRVPVAFPSGPFGRREFTIADEFDVQEGTDNEILIHVDLRRSLKRTSEGGFILSPFTHVVPSRIAAQISGPVSDPSVTRICAYNVGGKRRHEGFHLEGRRGDVVSSHNLRGGGRKYDQLRGFGPEPGEGSPKGPGPGVPDATSSCDHAEAVSDVKDGRYELRYLPPVSFILRAFKNDGTYADTTVSRLLPKEAREVEL